MRQTLLRGSQFLLLSALVVAPASAQLPNAKELNARFIAAVGGADVLKKHTAMHAAGNRGGRLSITKLFSS